MSPVFAHGQLRLYLLSLLDEAPRHGYEVIRALEDRFGEPRSAEIVWKPKSSVPIDEEAGQKLLRMIEGLEDSDDVQNVYANFEIADEILERLSA